MVTTSLSLSLSSSSSSSSKRTTNEQPQCHCQPFMGKGGQHFYTDSLLLPPYLPVSLLSRQPAHLCGPFLNTPEKLETGKLALHRWTRRKRPQWNVTLLGRSVAAAAAAEEEEEEEDNNRIQGPLLLLLSLSVPIFIISFAQRIFLQRPCRCIAFRWHSFLIHNYWFFCIDVFINSPKVHVESMCRHHHPTSSCLLLFLLLFGQWFIQSPRVHLAVQHKTRRNQFLILCHLHLFLSPFNVLRHK